MRFFNFGKKKKNDYKKFFNEELDLNKFFRDIEDNTNEMGESTYFICLKVLSEALGKLPLKAYKRTKKGGKVEVLDKNLYVLSKRPNSFTTASSFWANVEMRRNHYGNAYVYLDFKRGKDGYALNGMYILENENVKIVIDNARKFTDIKNKIFYRYKDMLLNSDDILHFKTSLSNDGVTGLSVREQLANMLSTSREAENYLNGLYKGGLTSKGALEYTADLKEDAIQKALDGLKKYGVGKSRGAFLPIPPGFNLKPLNLTLQDSQFLENKKFTSMQIAGAFGVKPYLLNDYQNSNLGSCELQSLSFYVDTLLFILKHYEEEIDYKIINRMIDKETFYQFNPNAILRVSAKEQMEILTQGVNNGVYKPNEARNFLNMDSTDGGDVLMCNGNYIPITEIGNQYNENL